MNAKIRTFSLFIVLCTNYVHPMNQQLGNPAGKDRAIAIGYTNYLLEHYLLEQAFPAPLAHHIIFLLKQFSLKDVPHLNAWPHLSEETKARILKRIPITCKKITLSLDTCFKLKMIDFQNLAPVDYLSDTTIGLFYTKPLLKKYTPNQPTTCCLFDCSKNSVNEDADQNLHTDHQTTDRVSSHIKHSTIKYAAIHPQQTMAAVVQKSDIFSPCVNGDDPCDNPIHLITLNNSPNRYSIAQLKNGSRFFAFSPNGKELATFYQKGCDARSALWRMKKNKDPECGMRIWNIDRFFKIKQFLDDTLTIEQHHAFERHHLQFLIDNITSQDSISS